MPQGVLDHSKGEHLSFGSRGPSRLSLELRKKRFILAEDKCERKKTTQPVARGNSFPYPSGVLMLSSSTLNSFETFRSTDDEPTYNFGA